MGNIYYKAHNFRVYFNHSPWSSFSFKIRDWLVYQLVSYILISWLTCYLPWIQPVFHTKHTKDWMLFWGQMWWLHPNTVFIPERRQFPCSPLWFQTDKIVFYTDQKSNFKPPFLTLFSLGNGCLCINNWPICPPHWEVSLMMLCTELIWFLYHY